MKKFYNVFLCIILAAIMAGCSNNAANTTKEPNEANSNAVETELVSPETEESEEPGPSNPAGSDTEGAAQNSTEVPETENVELNTTAPVEASAYEKLVSGDYSDFAGTYEALEDYHDWYGGGKRLPKLILQEDGIITGGQTYGSYPDTKPISVEEKGDGTYLCQVNYSSEIAQDYFVIYPKGIVGDNPYSGADPALANDIYIRYVQIDGGVSDIIYVKTEG